MIQKYVGQKLRITPGLLRSQRGITGLETAIVLIAFVVVSSVFAFSALSAGLFSSDKAKDTIHAGIAETRSSMELKGATILTATSSGTTGSVSQISFQVAQAAGGAIIDLTPGAIFIRYTDRTQSKIFDSTAGITISPVGQADADNLLERNETIRIDLIDLDVNFHDTNNNTLKSKLGTGTTFTLEIVPASGAVMHIERTTPVTLDLQIALD